jgi:hypothetical protein
MHRSVASRLFAALVAVWFTINMVEPAWLHACPVHDGLVIATAADHHAAESGSMAHHGASHGDSQSPDKAHLCQCLGACTAAAMVAAPVSSQIVTGVVRVAAPRLPEYFHPVFERAYELPFANGPPRA